MNKTIASLILALGATWTAGAGAGQPAGAPPAVSADSAGSEAGKHHGIKLKQLSQELGLSDKQESRLKSLFKKHKQQIREIREESKQEAKDTLTPAQKLKLYRLKEKNSEKFNALKQAVEEE